MQLESSEACATARRSRVIHMSLPEPILSLLLGLTILGLQLAILLPSLMVELE
jgi:type II secretory pathway component PulF